MNSETDSELDFGQKERGSAVLQAEDWFCLDDLLGTLEGEPEAAEVPEGSPAVAHGRPVEELEASLSGIGRSRTPVARLACTSKAAKRAAISARTGSDTGMAATVAERCGPEKGRN